MNTMIGLKSWDIMLTQKGMKQEIRQLWKVSD